MDEAWRTCGFVLAGEEFLDLGGAQRKADRSRRSVGGQCTHCSTARRPAEVVRRRRSGCCCIPLPRAPGTVTWRSPRPRIRCRTVIGAPAGRPGGQQPGQAALPRPAGKAQPPTPNPRLSPGRRSTDRRDVPPSKGCLCPPRHRLAVNQTHAWGDSMVVLADRLLDVELP